MEENLIFYLAGLSEENYKKLAKIFTLFEAGKLCKLPKCKQGLLSASVECAPSNFKGLRGLSEEVVSDILDEVINKKVDLKQINNKCKEIKDIKKMKIEFSKQTGVKNWSEAQQAFPYYATDDKLQQFAGKAFNSKDVPSAGFLGFCRKALASKQQGVLSTDPTMSVLTYKVSNFNCKCILFDVSKPIDLTYSKLNSSVPGFSGFRVMFTSINTQFSVRKHSYM